MVNDAVTEAEGRGREWQRYSIEYLIETARHNPGAASEIQRRLLVALSRFSRTSTILAILLAVVTVLQLVVAILQLTTG